MSGILANSLSKTMTVGLGPVGAVTGYVKGEQIALSGGTAPYSMTVPEGSTAVLADALFTPDKRGNFTVMDSAGNVLVIGCTVPVQSEAVNGLRFTEVTTAEVPTPPSTAAYLYLRDDGRLALKTATQTWLVVLEMEN